MEVTQLGAERSPFLSEDYAWAAGIIEGEGTITFEPIKNRKNSFRHSIAVTMTDKDIIDRLLEILKVGTVCGPYKGTNKPLWTWAVQNQSGCFDTLIRIGPYLGIRRKEKAAKMFASLEEKLLGS